MKWHLDAQKSAFIYIAVRALKDKHRSVSICIEIMCNLDKIQPQQENKQRKQMEKESRKK